MKILLSIIFPLIFCTATAHAGNLQSVDDFLRKKSDEISVASQNLNDMVMNISDHEYRTISRALDREMLFEVQLSDLGVMLDMHLNMIKQQEKKNSQKLIQLVCKHTRLTATESIKYINEALPSTKEDALTAELTKLRDKIQETVPTLDKCEQ